ncbi:gluconate transporter [Chroococcidiopsis sp. CCALA 051]|jgi:Gnt-I system low-affinity gluconate transporter|uniref:GntP family permease n=1 Tax=Chroococcidiopsis sp. CCALA 051 TaxID=869949 RepID=UPI000D0DD560|nr:gluconate:H+ symporter [Chroococcidiopsis sp. CCALA 051]PSM45639.1 gluconate transporter [Chroococcidiopsis sp. CCALA 051]
MSPGALIFVAMLGVALLLFLVIGVRLQAFVALLLTSLFVAIAAGIPLDKIAETIQQGMGSTLGFIAIVVGLGTMFGEMLRVSGGAEVLAATLVKKFGQDKAQWALSLTGLIVAIPVFFDVGLIILIPLVYGLAKRTGKSLLYYAIPLTAGLAIGHSYIPPTPGPVAVASLINADLGWVILFGAIAGIPATIFGGVLFGKYIAGKIHATVPEYMEIEAPKHELGKEPPRFGTVVSIIAIPLVLILLNTVSTVILPEGNFLRNFLTFLGHPFTALMIAALLSFYILGIKRGYSLDEVQQIATKSLEPVGLIILVTGAGGVFGRVLVASGVGDVLARAMAASNLPIILLAFLIATAVRVSQGSATVSMVTAAGIMAPAIEAGKYSPPMVGLITIAIASGATVLSHVNDSGFWLVSRYLGLSEKETLRAWTVMETIVGCVGFLVVFIISFFV